MSAGDTSFRGSNNVDSSACRRQHPEIKWSGLSLIFFAPALGGFLYGYDIGATSFVLAMLNDDSDNTESCWWSSYQQARWKQGLTVGAVSAGALLGSHLVLFYCSQFLGRRSELRLAAILYLCGSLANCLSGSYFQYCQSLGWYSLVLGRLLFGVGVGFVMHAAPTYMAEMAPSSIRGAIVSAKETAIVLGIVIGYGSGDFVSNIPGASWILLYAVTFFLSIPMLVLTFYIPRSKRWLLMRGYKQEAAESMTFVFKGDIDRDFQELTRNMDSNQSGETSSTSSGCAGLSSALSSVSLRPALRAALGLVLLQQLSGQPSIISYAPVLFKAAGWNGHATVVTAILMFCVSGTTVMLVDRLGRKTLMYVCVCVLFVALGVLSSTFWSWNNGASNEFGQREQMCILVALFSYIGGYQIGFGPITWLVVSEVFPGDKRGSATALAVEFNYLLNFLVQFALPVVQNQIGWGPTFATFAAFMLGALAFIYKFVPETAGMSLEDIEVQLSHRKNDKGMSSLNSEYSPLLVSQEA